MPVGELAALVAALVWSLASMLFGRVAGRVSPMAMNAVKCATAGTLLMVTRLALGADSSLATVPMTAWILLAASSLVGVAIGDSAYFGAMAELGVPRAILLLSSAPLFAALGGVVFLGEVIDLRSGVGIVVTVAGLALVVMRRDPAGRVASPRGILFGLLSAISQASGSVLSRRAMQDGIDPLAAAATRLVVATLTLVAVGAAMGALRTWRDEIRRDGMLVRIAGASLIGTYMGIWLAQVAIQRSSSTGVASTLLAVSPIFALPLAHVTGLERVTPRAVVGALIALGGIVVLTWR